MTFKERNKEFSKLVRFMVATDQMREEGLITCEESERICIDIWNLAFKIPMARDCTEDK